MIISWAVCFETIEFKSSVSSGCDHSEDEGKQWSKLYSHLFSIIMAGRHVYVSVENINRILPSEVLLAHSSRSSNHSFGHKINIVFIAQSVYICITIQTVW